MAGIVEVTDLAVDLSPEATLFRRGAPRRILSDISFSLAEKETTALVGPSGAGKSTLARAILGLLPIAAGVVRIDGRIWCDTARPHLQPSKRDMRILRRDAQIVFQNPGASLTPHLTIREQVEEAMALHEIGDAAARRMRAEDCLALSGLDRGTFDRRPRGLSGGERQRAALARAIAPGPKVLILDEATAALDVWAEAKILEVLRGLSAALGLTILFVTHDVLLAARIAHRILCIDDKSIVEDATAERFIAEPASETGRRLVHAARQLARLP